VSSEVKKVLFIVNKFAGTGYQESVEGRIIDACNANEIECTIEYTNARGHATELAAQAASEKKFKQVIAVGGDGTVNEVAQGLLHSDTPMGILPKGSGNGLARHLKIPMNLPKALTSLFISEVIAMDTFLLNGKLSLNVSGIGFDGHIANLFGETTKRGLVGYTKLTLKEFVHFKEFEAEITVAEKVIKRKAFVMAIANSSQYGNNARIAPIASVCDQIIHVSLLKKVPPYRLDTLYKFFTGQLHKSSYCETLEIQKMSVKLDKVMAYHIDGEPSGRADKFEIEIQPHSLKMLAPKSAIGH
jgi:diacylglycerol kinase (ATP)